MGRETARRPQSVSPSISCHPVRLCARKAMGECGHSLQKTRPTAHHYTHLVQQHCSVLILPGFSIVERFSSALKKINSNQLLGDLCVKLRAEHYLYNTTSIFWWSSVTAFEKIAVVLQYSESRRSFSSKLCLCVPLFNKGTVFHLFEYALQQ